MPWNIPRCCTPQFSKAAKACPRKITDATVYYYVIYYHPAIPIRQWKLSLFISGGHVWDQYLFCTDDPFGRKFKNAPPEYTSFLACCSFRKTQLLHLFMALSGHCPDPCKPAKINDTPQTSPENEEKQ